MYFNIKMVVVCMIFLLLKYFFFIKEIIYYLRKINDLVEFENIFSGFKISLKNRGF